MKIVAAHVIDPLFSHRCLRCTCWVSRRTMIAIIPTRKAGSLVLACFLLPGWLSAQPGKVAAPAEYHRYIDPLMEVTEFRTHYYEDGAADATVLFPESSQPPYGYLMPAAPVIALVRLRDRSLPLPIACLGGAAN